MIIGITGSIASGKSSVSHYLIEKGYIVLDADRYSYDALTIDKHCIALCLEQFDCADNEGKIDRKKLGAIIFNDKAKQKALEDIVHPYVIDCLKQGIEKYSNQLLFLDIPLLYESHLEYLCDEVVVVDVDEKTQYRRLMKRNGFTYEEAKARIEAQMPLAEKREKADHILDNRGDLESLYQQIDQLLEKLERK